MNLVERIDNLTDEQRKQILIKSWKDMERVMQKARINNAIPTI